jgi:hypothetical protein
MYVGRIELELSTGRIKATGSGCSSREGVESSHKVMRAAANSE